MYSTATGIYIFAWTGEYDNNVKQYEESDWFETQSQSNASKSKLNINNLCNISNPTLTCDCLLFMNLFGSRIKVNVGNNIDETI